MDDLHEHILELFSDIRTPVYGRASATQLGFTIIRPKIETERQRQHRLDKGQERRGTPLARECLWCKKIFGLRPAGAGSGPQKVYCSSPCVKAAKAKAQADSRGIGPVRCCLTCGTEFPTRPAGSGSGKQKMYCTTRCRDRMHRKRKVECARAVHMTESRTVSEPILRESAAS